MLTSLLPTPKHSYSIHTENDDNNISNNNDKIKRSIPCYPHRVESQFLPRDLDDYNNGGAYPEIHVVQYPLNMVRPGHKSISLE